MLVHFHRFLGSPWKSTGYNQLKAEWWRTIYLVWTITTFHSGSPSMLSRFKVGPGKDQGLSDGGKAVRVPRLILGGGVADI